MEGQVRFVPGNTSEESYLYDVSANLHMVPAGKRLAFLVLVLLGLLVLALAVRSKRLRSSKSFGPTPVVPVIAAEPEIPKEPDTHVDRESVVEKDPAPAVREWVPLDVEDPAALPDPAAILRSPNRALTSELLAEFSSLTLLGLKEERSLELWGHRGSEVGPELLRVYPFTGFSGAPGPKLREGDGQIPEGIYRIEYLNPHSSYHRSMKLDYPNAWDRAKGLQDERVQLGFDIFIHGSFVTVGCIPIGDEAIEELFTAVETFGYRKVTVITAPWDMRVREEDPEIDGIDWEAELYAKIREEIALLGMGDPQ